MSIKSGSNTIKISKPKSDKNRFDVQGRLRYDTCAKETEERDVLSSGDYQLSGYDPTYHDTSDYSIRLDERGHYQKVYRNPFHYVNKESDLFHAKLSNMRYINQLSARPYAGFYSGPGVSSIGYKDIESSLQQGILTNLRQKPCETCRDKSMYRFQSLPEFGNPQRIEHIDPQWQLGGVPTRDYVRRVDYQKRCENKNNNKVINK